MKQSIFLTAVIVITAVVAIAIYLFVLGNPEQLQERRSADGARTTCSGPSTPAASWCLF